MKPKEFSKIVGRSQEPALEGNMEAPGSFPLVLEGPWGPDPPKKLRLGLQRYFQSPRRSGGAECVLSLQKGCSEILVLFESEEVRQRVLKKENHELELPGQEKLKLIVRLPTAKDGNKISEKSVTTEEFKIKDGVQEQGASEDQDTTFSLERKSVHTKSSTKDPGTISSLIVFKNVQNTVTEDLLILLVENMSGFSETNGDFTVEIIPETEIAVVTFLKPIDRETVITICAKNHKVGELIISASPLEVTRTILVEDLPPGVNEHYITLFFENPQNGGGPVTRIQYFPKENSALIQFDSCTVLDTILAKKLLFNNSPISMFPYYPILNTALYGKKKPSVKLPEPLTVPIEPYLLKFLRKNDHLIGEITSTMERAHCELTWPQPNCIKSEIILSPKIILDPSATLVGQRTKRNIIKTWSEDVSKRISCLKTEYQLNKYKVHPMVWEDIRDSIENENILIEFDKLQETVIIVGRLKDVQKTDPQMKTLIERATQKMEKEKQSMTENFSVCPGRFSISYNNRLEEILHKKYPELKVTYDTLTKSICLTGLTVEVYKAKSEILEKLQSLTQKSLHFPPEIIQFLKQVNYETFSESLFGAEKIPAAYMLEGEAVVLIGASPQVLSEAEEHMKKVLNFRCISKVDGGVFNDCEWKTLIDNLNKKYNSSSKAVIIEQQNSDIGVKITIAGYVSPVCEIYQELYEFIEKNTEIQKFVTVISLAIIKYMKMQNMKIWHELKKKNVKVSFKTQANQRGILLSGPKGEVMRGVSMVKQTLHSIHVKNVSLDQPGAETFFIDRQYIREAKLKHNCLICLQEDEEESSGGSTDGQNIHCKITFESGILLTVQEGDLTQFLADVVVNAANEELKHHRGLAAALSKAAGPDLQRECDQIIHRGGKLSPGLAIVSDAGQLPCQQLIHAVVPQWKQECTRGCKQLLKNAIMECLYLAEIQGHISIAIPVLSFGFPLKEYAETIILSIKENLQDSQYKHSLKKIHIVDSSEETVQALSKAVKNVFKRLFPEIKSMPCTQSENQETNLRKKSENRNMLASIQTREDLSILLMKGDIQDAKTDVIVNSISLDFPLNGGALSQAIMKKAGPSLQEELNAVGRRMELKRGSVLLTSGCNLNCIFVLHALIPKWDDGKGHSQKIMEDIVRECLDTTEILSLTSVTFPAIGTGSAKFPKAIFAQLILSQAFQFSCRRPLKTLKEVHILLQSRDKENIKVFSEEFTRWESGNINPTSFRIAENFDIQDFFGTISNTAPGVYETAIGSISFTVASGDISKEQEDVIVNSTSETFTYKGGVSKAILEAAGPAVELECAQLAAKPHGNFIITQGGNLKCQKIIHVLGHKDVKETVSSVLQECEQMKMMSISLPLIGTGNAKQDPAIVAKKIIDAIEEFAWKGPAQSVKKVKVVIFLPQLLKVFYDVMKKREGSVVPTYMFSKLKGLTRHNLVFGKKIESTVFQICGESEENVESTISWIKDLILKEQKTYISSDEAIQNFGEEEFKELNKLQKSLNVTISPQNNFCLQVVGFAIDVLKASSKIENMIGDINSKI